MQTDSKPSGNGPSEDPEGIDSAEVTAWFEAHVESVEPPLQFSLITGGHSNLTYSVTDSAQQRWVLRRPPLGQVLATAHDMGREHRIMAALAPTDVPVPPVVGLSADDSVNGAPFYVMDYVDGTVVRDLPTAESLAVGARSRASEQLIEILARIHAVDPEAVGLGDLGRREGYLQRQLARWHGQFEASKVREIPLMDELAERLAASVPEQGPAAIVHGDYRLDNCLLADSGDINAVLDWEICTLGDPLADLGLLMVYWNEPGEDSPVAITPATSVEGFWRRRDLLDHYEKLTGRPVDNIDYYVAFGYWKLACILEGVFARYSGGSMGERSEGAAAFGDMVLLLAEAANDAAARAAGGNR